MHKAVHSEATFLKVMSAPDMETSIVAGIPKYSASSLSKTKASLVESGIANRRFSSICKSKELPETSPYSSTFNSSVFTFTLITESESNFFGNSKVKR